MVCPKYKCTPSIFHDFEWKIPALYTSIYRDSSNAICLRIEASIQPRFELMAYLNKQLREERLIMV